MTRPRQPQMEIFRLSHRPCPPRPGMGGLFFGSVLSSSSSRRHPRGMHADVRSLMTASRAGAKVIRSVLPIFLVAALSTLNVINKTTDNANLENSIAISLTLVFLLPELKPHTTFFTKRKDGDGKKGKGSGVVSGLSWCMPQLRQLWASDAITSDDMMIIFLFLGYVSGAWHLV